MASPEVLQPKTPTLDLALEGFDIQAAFVSALQDVVSDESLALTEKIQRMEVIVQEGTSELYRDFVDIRNLAAEIAFYCDHDHTLQTAVETSNGEMRTLMDAFKAKEPSKREPLKLELQVEANAKESKTDKKKNKKEGWLRGVSIGWLQPKQIGKKQTWW